MAYNEFAYFYDELNGEADYDALFDYIKAELQRNGVEKGIVADLGCGTGDLTLMLTQCGYDMIAVDLSEEMLSVLYDKADQLELSDKLLVLHQDITKLDLYGTIKAAVSTFDTFNHIGPKDKFEQAITRTSLFMEQNGVFVFDLNTPYKHQQVLGSNEFELETPDVHCVWHNHYDETEGAVTLQLNLQDLETQETWQENFKEYTYPLAYVTEVLNQNGFVVQQVCDGETFQPLTAQSQRYMITAVKQ